MASVGLVCFEVFVLPAKSLSNVRDGRCDIGDDFHGFVTIVCIS